MTTKHSKLSLMFLCVCSAVILFVAIVVISSEVKTATAEQEAAQWEAIEARQSLELSLAQEETEYEDVVSSTTLNMDVQLSNSFIFFGDDEGEPLLKISEEGFWVKGVKVDDTPEGYQKFYEAFKALLEGR